jgi:hypothetical protein
MTLRLFKKLFHELIEVQSLLLWDCFLSYFILMPLVELTKDSIIKIIFNYLNYMGPKKKQAKDT